LQCPIGMTLPPGRSKCAAETAIRLFEIAWNSDVQEAARTIRCPVLIVHAERDLVSPVQEGQFLARLIPNCHTSRQVSGQARYQAIVLVRDAGLGGAASEPARNASSTVRSRGVSSSINELRGGATSPRSARKPRTSAYNRAHVDSSASSM
jgi:pimeloyl-ACP methyl ester carboxylesterase